MLLAIAVAVGGMAISCAARPEVPARPNVVILMADDWNWPQSEMVADPNLRMPTFDRIVREGVRFDNAFVNAPSCTPSRAALLTGMHPWQLETGVHLWGALPAKFDTYTDALERAGYLVGYSGKGWGPGFMEETGRGYNPAGRIVVGPAPGRPWDSADRVAGFEDFLARRDGDQPFHFWFNTGEPHRPYEWQSGIDRGMRLDEIVVPPTLRDTEATRTDLADYFYEVEIFDAAAGEIVAQLERAGELENTIVVITGDNGMPFPRAKATLYDLGTRVPLAVRWPARFAGGRALEDFVTLADLAPTLLEAAGLEPLPQMSASSFLPALTSSRSGLFDPDRTRAMAGIETHCGRYPMRSLRTAEYLYIRNFEPERPVNICAEYWETDAGHNPSWIAAMELPEDADIVRRIVDRRPAEELYALAEDPYQFDNLADVAEYSAIREQLAAELADALKRTGDPRSDGTFEEVFYVAHERNAERRQR